MYQRLMKSLSWYHLAFFMLFIIASTPNNMLCLEQDAQILRPMTTLVKSIISAVTLGTPGELEFGGPMDFGKNLVSLTWRTGFPMTIPSGFLSKTQNFINRVRAQIQAADVKNVKRKTLANLKLDLDAIVDAIEDQVRLSQDGLYTDYEAIQVNGAPLEDALTAIGIQLKAYGVDVTNYRNIASAILGLPLLPTMAAALVDASSRVPNLATVANLTATMYQTGNQLLPEAASESIDRLRSLFPALIPPALQSGEQALTLPPLSSLFGSLAPRGMGQQEVRAS